MGNAIPLLDLNKQHLGFMLVAGVPDDYPTTVGQWEADCVFMGSPREARLVDEPAFCVIAQHRAQGEHRVTIRNDGTIVSFEAHSPRGEIFYLIIPRDSLGEWGTQHNATRTKYGYAHFIST